jgi:integrase family protein with SAM-like domain
MEVCLFPDTPDTAMDTQLAPITPNSLSTARFAALSAIPPEAEWCANLRNRHTREHYQRDIRQFIAFAGLGSVDQLREVTRPHVLAWRDHLHGQGLANDTIRRTLAALSSLLTISVTAMLCCIIRCWASSARPR